MIQLSLDIFSIRYIRRSSEKIVVNVLTSNYMKINVYLSEQRLTH